MKTQNYVDPKLLETIGGASERITMGDIAEQFAALAGEADRFGAASLEAKISWTQDDEVYDGKYEPVLILRVQRL
jgi:hypothetical protein